MGWPLEFVYTVNNLTKKGATDYQQSTDSEKGHADQTSSGSLGVHN